MTDKNTETTSPDLAEIPPRSGHEGLDAAIFTLTHLYDDARARWFASMRLWWSPKGDKRIEAKMDAYELAVRMLIKIKANQDNQARLPKDGNSTVA